MNNNYLIMKVGIMREKKKVHLIACGVLSMDIMEIEPELGIDMSVEYLPGGLHETPLKLRERLQEAIDVATVNDVAEVIALGYGVCGKGTVGLRTGNIPLVIPRVHDCIALFLGSDKEYKKQFAACPGTYYITAGWVNEKSSPQDLCKTCQLSPNERVDFSFLVEKYGESAAEHITEFYSSWQKNYERAAYIDTGVVKKDNRYAAIARRMAEDLGWRYESLKGTHHLLKTLLTTETTTDEILYVPRNHVTVWDAVQNGLGVSPLWTDGLDSVTSGVFLDKAGKEITEGEYQKMSVNDGDEIGMGIGVDAGGTYTDVVLYDFRKEEVLKKAKAPTTNWDFTIGINQAIEALELTAPQEIDLVTLSTTLATNSIVEGKGQKVGLLIMPPYGIYHDGDIDYSPVSVISGRLDINGKEVEPVEREQVREIAARMIEKCEVEAFAVTGFSSINNNIHEVEVKRIIQEEFGCSVTCGHEISADMNYRVRAVTSALNARIIPCLERLLTQFKLSLQKQRIDAKEMVVRSDGSLMNVQAALLKPIETILSGPASSAKGAGYLAGVDDGLVVDIGGTTTDTAILRNGKVVTNSDGASVGGYRTHIKTLDLRTAGLGGDSNISRVKGKVVVGPRRVLPVSRAVEYYPEIERCVSWIKRNKDLFADDSHGMEILVLTDKNIELEDSWSDKEASIIRSLKKCPMTLQQLTKELGSISAKYLPLERLEGAAVVQRAGLTPTDLLHVQGKVSFADSGAAQELCGVYADISGMTVMAFADVVLLKVRKMLTLEMIKRELSSDIEVDGIDDLGLVKLLLNNLYTEGSADYRVGFDLNHPIIGIGAPTADMLIPANKWLKAECIIPEHAEVANAVGAIISPVHIEKIIRIEPGIDGEYIIQGLTGSPAYSEFETAHEEAVVALHKVVLEAAAAAGTESEMVKIIWKDRIADSKDSDAIFIAREYSGEITGMPSKHQE